jgi:hypothetical protein
MSGGRFRKPRIDTNQHEFEEAVGALNLFDMAFGLGKKFLFWAEISEFDKPSQNFHPDYSK